MSAAPTPTGGLNSAGKENWSAYLDLLVVYVVWGSTYLAIRVTVGEGGGFPPFIMGAMRVMAAGVLLLLWAGLTRSRLRPAKGELLVLAASGLLLWTGGNGLVIWAEQRADSAYAALLVGSMPIWVAVMVAFLDRKPPSWLLAGSLLIGFAGLGLLTAPVLATGTRADTLAVIALLAATVSWGIGSLLLNRKPVGMSVIASSAYQHLFGGIGFAVLVLVFNEPLPNPSPAAWWAWSYLVVFGSLLAFTSFVRALRSLPTNIVMTYAYVNPVIAVILGRLILNEAITAWTLGGAALILLGVAGVFRDRQVNGKAADGAPGTLRGTRIRGSAGSAR
ncbi:MAG: EamA family transporter [Bacillota bacterium]